MASEPPSSANCTERLRRLAPKELMRLRDPGISAGFIRVSNQGDARLTPDELIRLRDRGGHQ